MCISDYFYMWRGKWYIDIDWLCVSGFDYNIFSKCNFIFLNNDLVTYHFSIKTAEF